MCVVRQLKKKIEYINFLSIAFLAPFRFWWKSGKMWKMRIQMPQNTYCFEGIKALTRFFKNFMRFIWSNRTFFVRCAHQRLYEHPTKIIKDTYFNAINDQWIKQSAWRFESYVYIFTIYSDLCECRDASVPKGRNIWTVFKVVFTWDSPFTKNLVVSVCNEYSN